MRRPRRKHNKFRGTEPIEHDLWGSDEAGLALGISMPKVFVLAEDIVRKAAQSNAMRMLAKVWVYAPFNSHLRRLWEAR